MIQPARISDSGQIAELHYSALNTGFLSKLGVGFLNALYKYLIKNEIVLVAREGDKVWGYVSCSLNSAKVMRRFILNPEGVFKFLVGVISNPSLIIHSIETLSVPLKHKSAGRKESTPELPGVELLSISVDPNSQKHGIGTSLLAELEKRLRETGVKQYKVIAGSSLTGANQFYKKNGFVQVTTVNIHGNEISNVYCKEL